jgi:protein-L-isoaspartate(D-aspartate) O-methyltransferase
VRWIAALLLLTASCGGPADTESELTQPARVFPRRDDRDRMVARQLVRRDIKDEAVLAAMRAVPRHEFVPESWREFAYDDGPLPIGHRQTISQPYIVAVMTELAQLPKDGRVLEIGTGSGYGAAVLSRVTAKVYSIEILEPLARRAAADLKRLGYDNVEVRFGDGYKGWPEHAPFDAIVVTAAPPRVPEPLKQQLKIGGRLVLPVGPQGGRQELRVLTRTRQGFRDERVFGVRFVPMTGEAQKNK